MSRPDTRYETILWYEWVHIPTGERGTHDFTIAIPRTYAIKLLDEMIERWNQQQPDKWRYRRITKS